MNMRCVIVSILIITSLNCLHAQEYAIEDTSEISADIPWEKMFEQVSEDDENNSAVDGIDRFENNLLDLNSASIEEIHNIPSVTNLVSSRIIEMRNIAPFADIDELEHVDGITKDMLYFIRCYATIKTSKNSPAIKGSLLSRTSFELEKRRGYLTGIYKGNPVKFINRINISAGTDESPLTSFISKVDAGFLMEKDPGERDIKDFSCGFIRISIPSLVSQITIGSFQIEAAEGLMFWRSSPYLKGGDVIAPVRKNGSGIHPYLSTNENSCLQGTALSIDLKYLKVESFYSEKFINASVDSTGIITSIDQTGLFRTDTEIGKKNSSREKIIGCRAIASLYEGFKIGISGYSSTLNNPLISNYTNNEIYNLFWMKGIDLSYTNQKIDIFAEMASDRADKLAQIYGLTYEPVSTLTISLLVRNYPYNFYSLHGNAFSEETGKIQNENGVYFGIRTSLADWICLSFSYDLFNHPKPTRTTPFAATGNSFMALTEFQLSEKHCLEIRFKRNESVTKVNNSDIFERIKEEAVPRIQENYRITGNFHFSRYLRSISRIEWVKVSYSGINSSENGLLISQTLKCRILHNFDLRARISLFDTDSYDTRIFEYEDDLQSVSSNPALYGRGIRWYLVSRFRLFKKIDLGVKYSQTIKDGIKSISSGLDEIKGNTQSLLSLQFLVRF